MEGDDLGHDAPAGRGAGRLRLPFLLQLATIGRSGCDTGSLDSYWQLHLLVGSLPTVSENSMILVNATHLRCPALPCTLGYLVFGL